MELSQGQLERYKRHILLRGIGEKGQIKLLESRVLLVGVGGLGSPIAMYLAAAGVGFVSLVDDGRVSLSNLQRQVIHSVPGVNKVASARDAMLRLNDDINVIGHCTRLLNGRFPEEDYDVVIDATDNIETRYILNAACRKKGIPLVHGAVSQFDGQVSVFTKDSLCYQCLYPNSNLRTLPMEAGVLGVVPGIIGMLQATETLKLLLGLGDNLVGKLLTFYALDMSFKTVELKKDPKCPLCNGNKL
ncbi:MAG: ThiF family adenylyltransferase [Lentisphaeria bacterium]